MNSNTKKKVTIVGAGAVGATYAYALAQAGSCSEIAICDIYTSLAIGQVMDLMQGAVYTPNLSIHVGTDEDFKDSDIVVIAVGTHPLEKCDRDTVIYENAMKIGTIAKRVAESGCNGIMLIVTNPVDYMTSIAYASSGWTRGRVIGCGTMLDTARFRHILSREFKVDIHNINGYVLGEHGVNEFIAWSLTQIAGQPVETFSKVTGDSGLRVVKNKADILREITQSTNHIVNYKGISSYAIATTLRNITEAILRDDNKIMPLSIHLSGEFGITKCSLSVPCLVGKNGVKRIITAKLSKDEQESLKICAKSQITLSQRMYERNKKEFEEEEKSKANKSKAKTK